MLRYLYNLATDKYKGFIPGLIKIFLFILSLFYGLIIRVLSFFKRLFSGRLDLKVISVGNITLGGTGKTVLVEYIARFLQQQGHKVAILTRGYKHKKAKSKIPKAVSYESMGDEPYMLSRKLWNIPVIIDANRMRAASKAVRFYSADTVILDDGFQQWGIGKDLDIAVVDATNPFGNGHMLPRGLLREPVFSLRRAAVLFLTKANLSKDVERIRGYLEKLKIRGLLVESIHKPLSFFNLHNPNESFDILALEAKTVTSFCGIGDPDSFENLIKILGINIGLSFRFSDHHDYTSGDLKRIIEDSRAKNITTVLTTEKDAARLYETLNPIADIKFLVLRIGLEITKGEKEFCDRLLKLYSL